MTLALARAQMAVNLPVQPASPKPQTPYSVSPEAKQLIAIFGRDARKAAEEIPARPHPPTRVASSELRAFYTYNIPFSESNEMERMKRDTLTAQMFLQKPGVSADAPALIKKRLFNTHLIAMANLLPNSAAEKGKPYGKEDRSHWDVIVCTLWKLLIAEDGRIHFDFAKQLRQVLINDLAGRHPDIADSAFFNKILGQANSLAADFETLTSYLVFACCQISAAREEGAAIVREQRQRTKGERQPLHRKASRLLTNLPNTPQQTGTWRELIKGR